MKILSNHSGQTRLVRREVRLRVEIVFKNQPEFMKKAFKGYSGSPNQPPEKPARLSPSMM